MNKYTLEEIQEKYDALPQELQDAISSSEISTALKDIGEKNGLHIDQIGILVDMVGLVMLGLMPSNEFVDNLTSEIEISEDTATTITNEINEQILSKLRHAIQVAQAIHEEAALQKDTTNSRNAAETASFEQAGDLSVEKPDRDDNRPEAPAPTDLENKDNILESIENPQPGNEKISRKQEQTYTEPLMDHLLQNPSARPEKKSALFSTGLPQTPSPSTSQSPETPAAQPAPAEPQPPQRSGPDPYKEPIN
jgi:hypothetical protein